MKAAMGGRMKQLWKVVWSSYERSYGAAMKAAMGGGMEQL